MEKNKATLGNNKKTFSKTKNLNNNSTNFNSREDKNYVRNIFNNLNHKKEFDEKISFNNNNDNHNYTNVKVTATCVSTKNLNKKNKENSNNLDTKSDYNNGFDDYLTNNTKNALTKFSNLKNNKNALTKF